MLTIAELERFECALNPRAVAIIGATREADRVGYSILESLLQGGFPGKVIPIHPHHENILGQKVYPSLDAAKVDPELVIIALNERATVKILDECGRHNVKAALCVAGGFKEMGQAGKELQQELEEAAVRNKILLVGPNTLGLINARARLNATFWPIDLDHYGSISIISQSGGVGQMIGFALNEEGLSFNKWFAIGNRAGLDFDDYLQALARDSGTEVIAVFMEGTEKARAFVELASRVVPEKPIVILKAGRHEIAQQSALTHTGSMAGSFDIYQDIFDQFGLISVRSVPEMISVSKALSIGSIPQGDRVAILTPTAGPSILLVDLLLDQGCQLAEFGEDTIRDLTSYFANVPVILKNPLDASAVGYASEGYLALAERILQDPGVDLLLALSIDHKNRVFPAEELVQLSKEYSKPLVVYFIGSKVGSLQYRRTCHAGGVPFYHTAEEAAWGTAGLINRRRILDRFGGHRG